MINRANSLFNIDQIIIHCSATLPSMDEDVDVYRIRTWHLNRGWDDIGYHYVITTHGDIQPGRSLGYVGAHAKGYNANSIGVCLVGGLDEDGNPANTFNHTQMSALKELIKSLMVVFPNISSVEGHRDLEGVSKACPCFDVKDFIYWRNL